MGAYMCIARNGVPPAVSKRIELGIDCNASIIITWTMINNYNYDNLTSVSPMIWVPAQLVGAYHGDTVTLTCFVEAHPTRCTSSILSTSVYLHSTPAWTTGWRTAPWSTLTSTTPTPRSRARPSTRCRLSSVCSVSNVWQRSQVEMKLTIKRAGEPHFGKYTCVAKNPRGQTDGSITLYGECLAGIQWCATVLTLMYIVFTISFREGAFLIDL